MREFKEVAGQAVEETRERMRRDYFPNSWNELEAAVNCALGLFSGIAMRLMQGGPDPIVFHCPECNGTEFLEGPHGGAAVNFCCANPACLARFNDMVMHIQRTGKVDSREVALVFNRGSYTPSTTRTEKS